MQNGILYIVSTPIGNLSDMTQRAIETLRTVDLIAAEDTRHCRPLLQHYGINTPVAAFHDHNEEHKAIQLIQRMQQGESIALISDAGTPLVNDPGFHLVASCHDEQIRVVPIPGPAALVCALSVAGLPTDRFTFEGFPPRTSGARQRAFEKLASETRTMIFYESSHRIVDCLADAAGVFGMQRNAAVCRELTKIHETLLRGTFSEIIGLMEADDNQRKGEFVLLISGIEKQQTNDVDKETERLLSILLDELPLKKAAAIASKISGVSKNLLYRHGLKLQQV